MLVQSPMHFTSIFEQMFGASHWETPHKTAVALIYQELTEDEDRDAL